MDEARTTRLMLVEDHVMVAEALRETLDAQPGLEVAGVATTLADALGQVTDVAPDVVLMDVLLPDGDGASGTAEVLARCPDARVLVLSAQTGVDVVARAVEAGAAGFVDKSTPLAELVQAIRHVADDGTAFEPDVLRRVAAHLRETARGPGADLTARELEILQLLTTAASVEQIATRLVLSTHTVRNHVRNAMAKLGAHSQLEAVVIAARAELVDLGGGDGP